MFILVIDPATQKPAISSYNSISRIFGELRTHSEFCFTHIEFLSPELLEQRLEDVFCKGHKSHFHYVKSCIGGILSLGSLANVTEPWPFLKTLAQDFENRVFRFEIPLFGICFTHQFFAHYFGLKVDYLKNKVFVKNGKHFDFRTIQILHPKFQLLLTQLSDKDYFSSNRLDLDFHDLVLKTSHWGVQEWNRFIESDPKLYTPFEYRLKQHLENNCLKTLTCHARHEQEVLEVPSSQSQIRLAATSEQCEVESLVHLTQNAYTIQTHPDGWPHTQDGYLLMKNFLYLCHIVQNNKLKSK